MIKRAFYIFLYSVICFSLLVSCSDDDPTDPLASTGTLEVITTTSGSDRDSGGYTIAVDGVSGQKADTSEKDDAEEYYLTGIATGEKHHPTKINDHETKNGMHETQYETVIIGGGQAGLATAYHLNRHRLPCVILAIMVFVATKVINVANPLGRKLRKHFFYPPRGIPRVGGTKKLLHKAGVEWVERTTGTSMLRSKVERPSKQF